MLRIAGFYAPTPDAVFDIVQQVFVELLQNIQHSRWDLDRDLDPLLARITRNIAIDYWKKYKRDRSEILQRIDKKLMEESLSSSRKDIRTPALMDCMKKLSLKNRFLLEDYYLNEVSVEELAAREKRSEASVYQLLYRLRVKLRECITKISNE